MRVWAAENLKADGELIWERDIWNGSEMMAHWMLLVYYQKHGVEFNQIEEEI